MTERASRRKAALEQVRDRADAFLVTAPANVRYLTGFTGTNGQVVLADEAFFLTDGRYVEQAAAQAGDLPCVVYAGGSMASALPAALAERGIGRLAFEAGHPEPGLTFGPDAPGYMTVLELERLRDGVPGVELVGVTGIVESLRVRKDESEIAAITRAQRIAEEALARTLASWSGGTEHDLALALEWAVRTAGADGMSFSSIVASGAHSALPHAQPRDVAVPARGVLLVDMGAVVDGYCSDMTRTFLRDAPDPLPAIHAVVRRALEAGCEAVRPGATGADVDAAARRVIEEAGYGDRFIHGLGHGVGLMIHEPPRLNATSDSVLEPGMIVTVEPGVYIPGVGGVRIEDLLVVTDAGAENLTAFPRGADLPSAR